jgi:hypothetical protein
MSNKRPVLTVGLARPFSKVRCRLHGHMGDLPCPWPACPEGVEYQEFDTQLLGFKTSVHHYYRRRWVSVDGSERYCWDIADDTSWFLANRLAHEEIHRLIPARFPRPDTVYHYTDATGLFGIVSSNHLWLTDYEFLNDSSELKFSLEAANDGLNSFDLQGYSPQAADLLPEWRNDLAVTVPTCRLYVASFSEDRDNLSLWRAYGAEFGVSLGFHAEALSLALLPGSFLNRIAYSPAEQSLLIKVVVRLHLLSVEWDLEKAIPGYDRKYDLRKRFFSHTLLQHLAFIKDPSFVDEREVRAAYIEDQELFERQNLKKATRLFRPRGRLIAPYIASDEEGVQAPGGMKMPSSMKVFKLPLTEVVVGPQPDAALVVRSIREFLLAHGFGEVEVNSSTIPYRRL